MKKCQRCQTPNGYNLICNNCGQYLYEIETQKLYTEQSKARLRMAYEVIYKELQNIYDISRKTDFVNEGNIPETTFESIRQLPHPSKASPIDIVCIAYSISCCRLEYFFQKLILEGDIKLGEYTRNEILCTFPESHQLAELSEHARRYLL